MANGRLQEIMAKYMPLKEAVASFAEQNSKLAWMNAQVYVCGWKGGMEFQPDGNGRGGLLPHEAEYLRKHIGSDAWEELNEFIVALNAIDEDEEKNLASLLANSSAPIGSKTDISRESSDDGNSTDAPSGKTRGKGSRKTTARSSDATTTAKTA